MQSDLPALFGRNVRAKRQQLRLSQEELAARSGLHRTYIGSIERGERNVSLDNVARIARALAVAPALLLEPVTPEGRLAHRAGKH
jgi:transcriptional regulator with XRE-family HTH domain